MEFRLFNAAREPAGVFDDIRSAQAFLGLQPDPAGFLLEPHVVPL